ncbi:cytidylate kinase [Microbacteriaceae bacterium MWH-Ta3]|nr:cytidylate kinase [Microbacteriaceae bacterium MWH-Ta3]
MSTLIVAVDGPAGSGKSSVSRAVATRCGFGFLDTGAAYRALIWWLLETNVDPADQARVAALLPEFPYAISIEPSHEAVTVDGTDITTAIRESRISDAVSAVAVNLEVRAFMKDLTRRLAAECEKPGIVIEGRDITTVVAPDAQARILLTAREEVRLARRAGEVAGASLADTQRSLRARDTKDSSVVNFLTAAPGVVPVDSSDLNFDQTVDAVYDIVRAKVSLP